MQIFPVTRSLLSSPNAEKEKSTPLVVPAKAGINQTRLALQKSMKYSYCENLVCSSCYLVFFILNFAEGPSTEG
jgi:hypothetical protein